MKKILNTIHQIFGSEYIINYEPSPNDVNFNIMSSNGSEFTAINYNQNGTMTIMSISIDPAVRFQGKGTKLLNLIEDTARVLRCHSIVATTIMNPMVDAWNIRHGFEKLKSSTPVMGYFIKKL